ncbi:unnamed protein product [Caenorhabditis auriculariae]|uniref:Golgin subfamily A conserved domain-containing protein n=1 Tax=Caenorhabditis auriculariae TaxID=2777116 RepID=A0A8S1HAA0_9PELO|nr:unnamed protein product [Caenorhabditis auriculariae]
MGDASLSGPSKAEKLAAAKKKLKEFESRRQIDGGSPSPSVVSEHGNGFNGTGSYLTEDSLIVRAEPAYDSANTSQASRSQSVHGNPVINGFTNQGTGVSVSPYPEGSQNEWYNAYQQLKAQNDELCAHYGELHSAYSQVTSTGVHVEAENQILQLQSALSTMVEEKLMCQTELRAARDELEEERQSHKELKKRLTTIGNSSGDQKALLAKIAEKDGILEARHLELESIRREAANAQAALLTVQHERSEAQARVRSLVRENTANEALVQQLRKDLQMKEIYLKQLGAHNIAHAVPVDENALRQMHDRIESLESQLNEAKNEKSRLLSESAALRAHYSEREQAMQEKQAELTAQLEEIQSIRWAAEANAQQLEDQLHITKKELEHFRSGEVGADSAPPAHPSISEEDVERRLKEAVRFEQAKWQRSLQEEQRNHEEQIQNKDRLIFEREQSLAEVEMKYRLLEERTLEANANGADLLSLSEQLQNEKATVSRAVAQNRELKAQLIDTEDRLIALTEEKLQLELGKQSAEHQVRELSKQLNLQVAGLVTPHSEQELEGVSVKKEIESTAEDLDLSTSSGGENGMDLETEDAPLEQDAVLPIERQNDELRQELDQARQELQQVRAELRRSNTQNEQMDQIMRQNAEDENQNSIHVELTQAVTRINELASENQQLRDALLEAQEANDRHLQQSFSREEPPKVEGTKEKDVVSEQPRPSRTGDEPPTSEGRNDDDWARKELEKRFARAMTQNAELTESIDRLEHINQQLQLENDTIADHVILYQHQRRLVRERLKVKDEQLRALESERTRTVERCQELQKALMAVLNKSGMLKEYQVSSIAKKAKRRVSRSYSHSTVDEELSGDEAILVDAKDVLVPPRDGDSVSRPRSNTALSDASTTASVHQKTSDVNAPLLSNLPAEEPRPAASLTSSPRSSSPSGQVNTEDADVRRILELITDISRPPPHVAGNLHCTQCIGEIQHV